MYDTTPRQAAYSGLFLREQGLTAIDNTPEELQAVVLEMLNRLDGREQRTATDHARQAQIAGILRGHGVDGFARMGHEFLQHHADLLPTISQRSGLAAA